MSTDTPSPQLVSEWHSLAGNKEFLGPFSSLAIGDRLLTENGGGDTVTRIVKLSYIAHGWVLGLTKGKHILFEDPIETWKYGPMVCELYEAIRTIYYKGNKKAVAYNNLEQDLLIDFRDPRLENSAEGAIVDYVAKAYQSCYSSKLVSITHKQGTPWHQSYLSGDPLISNDSIKNYYGKLLRVA